MHENICISDWIKFTKKTFTFPSHGLNPGLGNAGHVSFPSAVTAAPTQVVDVVVVVVEFDEYVPLVVVCNAAIKLLYTNLLSVWLDSNLPTLLLLFLIKF